MQLYSFDLGHLGGMAKGKIPYDAEQAASLANNLKTLMELNIGAAWAGGTGRGLRANVVTLGRGTGRCESGPKRACPTTHRFVGLMFGRVRGSAQRHHPLR